jgi:2-methylisocitrate lyase-like PEP mutase family enzyme
MTHAPHGTAEKASRLLRLHRESPLLTVVNVYDVISAKVVAETPGTRALATASHGIAATLGYEDGENIPVDEMIDMVGRIVKVTDLPVTADLEGGYGDAAETIRKAIGVGAVGANIEDQMKPLGEAVAQVEAILKAAEAEGVPDFVLNARTDALLKGEDLAEAITRATAYAQAGAPLVFVPGRLDEDAVKALVAAVGENVLTVIGSPGSVPLGRLEELGLGRVSYGPMPQRVALTALQELVEEIGRGGGVPSSMRPLN